MEVLNAQGKMSVRRVAKTIVQDALKHDFSFAVSTDRAKRALPGQTDQFWAEVDEMAIVMYDEAKLCEAGLGTGSIIG